MIFEEVKEVILEQLSVEADEITLKTSFEDLGVDSLDFFKIIIELEEKFNIRIEDAECIKTVEDAVNYVKTKI